MATFADLEACVWLEETLKKFDRILVTSLSGLHEWSVYQHHPHAEQEAEAVNIAGNITNVEAEASASDSLVLPTIFLAILLMC